MRNSLLALNLLKTLQGLQSVHSTTTHSATRVFLWFALIDFSSRSSTPSRAVATLILTAASTIDMLSSSIKHHSAPAIISFVLHTQHAYATTTAPAAEAKDPLAPFIPPWCESLLPAAPPHAAQIRSAKHLSSAYSVQQLPSPKWPEVAVLGRSNVGKSTLVNYLLGSSSLAKVSGQPGERQQQQQRLGRITQPAMHQWHSC